MIAKRLAAIVVALALILIAVGVRGALNKDDGESGNGSKPSGRPVVACTPDLQSICDALAADGLIAKGTDPIDLPEAAEQDATEALDGWITWDPVPEMINAGRATGALWGDSEVVFDAPMAFSRSRESQAALRAADCSLSETSVLGCLGAGAAEGTLTLGVGDPSTAGGLARLGQIAVGFVQDDASVDKRSLRAIVDLAPDRAEAEEAVTSQTQRALGATVVVAPFGLVNRIAATPGGEGAGLQAVPAPGQYLAVVLAPRRGVDLGGFAGDIAGPAKGAAAKLGLAAGDHRSGIDPGKLFQVWQALR